MAHPTRCRSAATPDKAAGWGGNLLVGKLRDVGRRALVDISWDKFTPRLALLYSNSILGMLGSYPYPCPHLAPVRFLPL